MGTGPPAIATDEICGTIARRRGMLPLQLLHADAESVLELVQGLEPAGLVCLVPEARHGALDHRVVAPVQRNQSVQRLFPAVVTHFLLPWPVQTLLSFHSDAAPGLAAGPVGRGNRDLRPAPMPDFPRAPCE